MNRSIIFLVVLLAVVFGLGAHPGDGERAVRSARSFGAHISGFKDADCVNTDTNDDGYCSCTLFLDDGRTKPIECGCSGVQRTGDQGCYSEVQVEGCREPKVILGR